jgi:hypothetical protein
MHYNFGRVHQTLGVTPAMEARIANHVPSIDEESSICSLKARQNEKWQTNMSPQ